MQEIKQYFSQYGIICKSTDANILNLEPVDKVKALLSEDILFSLKFGERAQDDVSQHSSKIIQNGISFCTLEIEKKNVSESISTLKKCMDKIWITFLLIILNNLVFFVLQRIWCQ